MYAHQYKFLASKSWVSFFRSGKFITPIYQEWEGLEHYMDEDHEEKKLSDAEVPIYPFAMKLLNFKNPSRNGGNLTFLTWTNKLSPCLCTQNNNNIIIIIIILLFENGRNGEWFQSEVKRVEMKIKGTCYSFSYDSIGRRRGILSMQPKSRCCCTRIYPRRNIYVHLIRIWSFFCTLVQPRIIESKRWQEADPWHWI